jgi:hypothetical protein
VELGKDEKWILEQARRTRQPIPKTFLNAPELFLGLDIYYLAFMDLTSCRELGHGCLGPISWWSCQQYCNEYGIEGEQREDMFYHIQKMDNAYLEWSTNKANSEAAQHRLQHQSPQYQPKDKGRRR